ncbi:hypothetical protein [Chamaesiphon sp. VAR_48_metabat_403]|uniref:hypothetical protein n=1 Tax=Chamaesiphon sp. VAR_48_metabat_403 TaxID=2964700 RepID=UPI00286E6E63|nr:hypothetical protein [Chamaesiphon sp. VAR_48_metabat_403]
MKIGQSVAELADIQGEFSTIGSGIRNDEPTNLAFLFADENRLYLRQPLFWRYTFLPEQIIAIEENSDRGIIIKHIRLDYPATIVFNSSVSASEMMSIITNKGFIPSALASDLPIREELPVREEVIIPIGIAIVLSLFTGDFGLSYLLDFQTQGAWRCPLIATLTIFAIRFFPPAQWIVFKPGRFIGEISPMLDSVVLILGLLAIASVLMVLGIPELVTVLLVFFILWLVTEIDLKFIP